MISECLNVRMWKASNSNNVISFNIMSRVCGMISLYFLKYSSYREQNQVYTLHYPSHHRFTNHRCVYKVRADSTIKKNPFLFLCHVELF